MAKTPTFDDMTEDQTPVRAEPVDDSALPQPAAPPPRFTAFSPEAEYTAEETTTLRLRLMQGLSPEVKAKAAEEGQWVVTGFPPVNTLRLIVAGKTDKRRFIEDNKVRCSSPDGKQGYGNPGILCADCPFSKWTNSGKTRADGSVINNPPPCQAIRSYTCWSVSHGVPVEWELKGTQMRLSQFLNTLAKGMQRPFAIDLTSMPRSDKGREWIEPVARIAPVSEQESISYGMMALEAANSEPAMALASGDLAEP